MYLATCSRTLDQLIKGTTRLYAELGPQQPGISLVQPMRSRVIPSQEMRLR